MVSSTKLPRQTVLKTARAKRSGGLDPLTHRQLYLRNYQRKWIAARRANFFNAQCCAGCGSTTSTTRLELDHIDPKTKVSHNIWSWSEARRNEEIAKCQVLCTDCHKAKTKKAAQKLTHGRIWMYIQGCRCLECRTAKSVAMRREPRRQGRKLRPALADRLKAQDCNSC